MKHITIIIVFSALFGILLSSISQAAPLSQNNSYDYQLVDIRLNKQSISSSNPTIQGTLPQVVEVIVKNTGTETWTRTPNNKGCAVHMGTDRDVASYFYHPGYDGWLETSDNSKNTYKGRRVMLANESATVLPGQQATFRFKLHVPTNTDKDTQTHKWNLVWEGSDSQCDNPQWFAHAPLSFQITLSNSKYSLVSAKQTEENGKDYAIITVRNEGPRVWYKEEQSLCKTFDPAKPDYCYYDQKAYRLATGLFDVKSDSNPYRVQDHVSPLYVENGEGWYSNNRVSPQENTVSPGQTATFKFALAKVSEPMRVYFTPVLEYAAWMQGNEISIDVKSSQSTVNQAPTAPTNLRYEPYENNKLKLSWDKAVDDGLPQGSQIRYWIQVIRNRDGQTAEEKWTILDDHYIWPFDPVTDVGTHRWRVKASDGALESDWSAEGTITIETQQSCQASPFTVESNLRDMVNVNLTDAQLDNYIRSQRPTSPLIGMGNDWLKIGRKYGINAIYIMAHAIHESNFGFSQIAQDKNNLFGYGAKDSCAYACAWTYTSKAASVDQVMHYVNRDYLTSGGAFYNGPTLKGMNVKYASDKKWGEKIARYMNQAATHIGLTSCGLSNQPTADVTKPNGRITAPTEGAKIQANHLTIKAEASDADSGVAYVQFNVNYDGRWLEIGKDSSPPYQVNWSVPNGIGSQLIHFGIHIVDKAGLIAYDPEGNVRTVFIESTANPSVKENWIPAERRAYLNQRSLGVYGDSMCGSASAAMILAMNGIIEKDYQTMYKVANAIYPNTIGAGGKIWMWQIAQQMTQRGLPSTVRSFGSSQTEWDTIKAEIDAGKPVFMASWKVTTGHFFVVVGYSEKSGEHQLIVYDPFGKWAGVKNRYNVNSYAASSHKGQWVTYNFEAVRGGYLITTKAQKRHLLPRQGQPSNPDRVSDEPETIQPYDGVPIEVAASTPSNNLLINGDFAQGTTGWKIRGNKNTITVVTNTVYNGTTAIRSEQRLTAADGAQWQGIEQTVPITGGRIYIIKARLNFQDTMGLHLKVEYRDRDNKRITEQLFKFPVNISNGWLELGGPIIAPAKANRAVITILHGTNGRENVAGGVVFIDQLSFTLTDCPDFTLCNGDFEQGLKNWYSSSTANIVAKSSYNGTTAIQSNQSYQANQARIWSGLRQIVKVVPGQTYQVCAQTKRENSAEFHVKIESFNSNQQNVKPLSEDIIVTNLNGNSDGWEKHCNLVTAPAQADHANLAIWHGVMSDKTNAPGGVVWIDDVTFTPDKAFDPGLYITKTASADIVQPGETVTFQVRVTHNLTTPVRLTDTLPAGLTVDPNSLMGGATYDFANHRILYNGQIDGNVGLTLTYQAKIDSNVAKGSVFYNSAEVTSGPYWNGAAVTVVYPAPAFLETLIMLYGSGDNNLDPDITTALNRAELGLHQSSARVLMVVDWLGDDNAYIYRLQADTDMGCPNAVNPTCNGRYTLGQNMWEWDENMGSHYSLLEFLRSMKKAYPNAKNVDQVILSLIGHGGGPIPERLAGQPASHTGQPASHTGQPASHTGQPLGGLLWDKNPGSSLTVAELKHAFELYQKDTGNSITLVYLDMCLMATLEVADEVAGKVDYLLASENWVWATFPYDKLVEVVDGQKTGQQIGTAWLDILVKQLQGDIYPYTFSLVDVTKIEPVKDKLNKFSQALNSYAITTDGRTKIKQAMTQTSCFDSNQDGLINQTDNYCDLADFAHQISTLSGTGPNLVGTAQALKTAIHQAIIKEAHQNGVPVQYGTQKWVWNNLGGLSIYMPLRQDNWKRTHYIAERFDLAEDTLWDEFLKAYWKNAKPPTPPKDCPDGCNLQPGNLPVIDNNINLSYTVTADTKTVLSWSGKGRYNLYQGFVNSITHFVEWKPLADKLSGGSYTVPQNSLSPGQEHCYQLKVADNEKIVSAIQCIPRTVELKLKLIIPDQNVPPNSLADVLVTIENATGLCIGAGNITLTYDPTIVEATGQIDVSGLTKGYQPKTSIPQPGMLRIAFANEQCKPLHGSGTLLRTKFKAIGQLNQQTALQFVTGLTQTTLYSKKDPTTPVVIDLQSGRLTLNEAYRSGDVNGDGIVNAGDALLALQITSKKYTPTAKQIKACDVSGNGYCQAGDATLIICFAATQDWSKCNGQSTLRQLNRQAKADAIKVTVYVRSVKGQQGETVTIPVSIKNAPEMAGGDFVLKYDKQAITPLSVSPTDMTNRFKMTHNLTDTGLIRVSMADDAPLQTQNEVTLFNITMRLNQPEYDLIARKVYLNDVAGLDFASNLQREIEIENRSKLSINFLPIVTK